MSVLPVQVVDGHQPWSSERIAALSDRGVLARAGALLGLPTEQLPLPLRWGPGPALIAALRTVAEVQLTQLEQSTGVCPDCAGMERRLDCARELGRLEARPWRTISSPIPCGRPWTRSKSICARSSPRSGGANPEWVAADAARLHSADRPARDSCWICRQRQEPQAEVRPAS